MDEPDGRLSLLVEWFARERGMGVDAVATGRTVDLRDALYRLLISRAPQPIPPDIDTELRTTFQAETARRTTVQASGLPKLADTAGLVGPLGTASLWQGDITTLQIDAIANAANEQMLGCFIPGHRCIDNAIHAVAGPWLRAECADVMARQGHLEPTGAAKTTGGHYLSADHVLHTVGPIVADRRPTAEHQQLLENSYRAVLDAALAAGAHSVALCSISTGVFGYPIELAAPVAVSTIAGWLAEHPNAGLHVVINTFSDRDTAVYHKVLAEGTG